MLVVISNSVKNKPSFDKGQISPGFGLPKASNIGSFLTELFS